MTLSNDLIVSAWAPTTPPARVRRAVRRHVLDGIGNALASRRRKVVRSATIVARGLGGPAEATIVGDRDRIGAPAAALANGALVHGLDFDDTHADALVHATAVVLPAGLAVAQEVGASGIDLVDALAHGYETVLRLGAAAQHGFHGRGFHATSVVGVYGAAQVAARLHQMDEVTAVSALGIAGSQAAGSLEFLAAGEPTKQLHPGMAAMNGILAARLAAAGATGPRTTIEGDMGLYALYTDGNWDASRITSGLGERWEIEQITIKPYPVCQLSHAAMDALATVRAEVGDPARIESIEVSLPADSMPIVAQPTDRKQRPQSTYDARFSLQFCLAMIAVHGNVGIDDLDDAQLGDPTLLELAARVTVAPRHITGSAAGASGDVTVTLTDGTTINGHVSTSSGGHDRPLDDDRLVAKFVANVGVDDDRTHRLAQDLLDLDAITDLSVLLDQAADLAAAWTTASSTTSPPPSQGARA